MKKAKKVFFIIFIICAIVFSIGISILAADACTCEYLHDWGSPGGEDEYHDFTNSDQYITYLPSEQTPWKLGGYMGLGVSTAAGAVLELQVDGYEDKQLVHVGKFMPDFLARSNKDFFCIEHGQGIMVGKLRYVTKIDITGDNVVATQLNGTTIQGIDSNDARKNTRILVKILKDAKSAATNDSTYSYNNETYYLRDRAEKSNGNFSYQRDTYQRILWKHLNSWRNTVLGEGNITEIGTNTNTDDASNTVETAAENQATTLYETLRNDTTLHEDGARREASIGITDESSNSIKEGKLSIEETSGAYTILGPFKYNYTGTIQSYNIYFNNDTSSVTTTKIGTWSGSTFTECQTIPDNSDFYIKVPTSYLTIEIQTLNISVSLAASEEKTTLYILRSVASGQHQMYVQQSTEPLTDRETFSYEIERPRTVTIEKKSTEGDALAEVTFKLYDENGNYINTYITGDSGTVQIPNIEIGKNYILEETASKTYGTKGTNITDATIDKGTIIERDEEKSRITFTVEDDAILEITNEVELGKLTIIKVDETTGEKVLLENVEFILWEMTGGYIRLFDKNTSKFIEEIKPEVDEEIDITDYRVEHVLNTSKDTPATRFITNSNGEIVINNLEIYVSAIMKNHYVASEVANNNYGYEGMILESGNIEMSKDGTRIIKEGSVRIENGSLVKFDTLESCIRQNDRAIKFNIDKNTILTINNVPKLGNLKIIKTGTDGNIQQGVEFELWELAGGYVRLFTEEYKEGETRLEFVDTIDSKNEEPIDMKNYVVQHVAEVTEDTLPTKFITNELGEILINNIEIYHDKDQKNHFFISEVKNDNYGYKGIIIEEATIVGGELMNFDNTESYIRQRDRAVKFAITEDTILTIKNKPQLGNVLINKESKDGEVLQDVEFIMTRGENEYVVLKDSEGNNLNPNKIYAEAIIDIDGQFGNNEYSITYSTDKDKATVFVTGEEGRINLENLEVYQPYVISRPKPVSSDADKNTEVIDTQPISYSYTIQEILNPNYGYVLTNTEELFVTINQLNPGETTEKTVLNESATRNLEIVKKDSDAEIYLGKVGFAIYTTTEGSSKKGYLSVYDENNNFQATIDEEITINSGYKLKYNYLYDNYENLTKEEKKKITIFETNSSGKININNLEVYERETGKTYQYQLIEVYNDNFGYEISPSTAEGIVLEKQDENEEDTKTVTVLNKQVYAKLSGYVWKEYADPKKTNPSDLLYNESSVDIKLTDLYIWNESEGVYEQNPNAEIPVKILLIDTETKEIIKEPDSFIYKSNSLTEKVQDAGKYTFEVEIAKLGNYQIVFEYDGFYYSTIIPNEDKDNGSKAVENETDRTELNNKFGTVESGDKIVSTDGESTGVIYSEVEENKSKLLGFVDENLTKVQAKTSMKLLEKFVNAKKDSDVPVVGIDNINMGLAQREQPILWITSNINSVEVNLENGDEKHKYTYDYSDAEIQMSNEEYYYNEEDGEYKSVKVDGEEEKSLINKLGEESEIPNFKAKIVKSDIQAAKAQKQEIKMGVSTIYRISLNNASGKLTSVVHEIKNYFDARFTIEEIGLSIDGNQIGNIIYKAGQGGNIVIEENVNVENADITTEELIYNSVIIPLGDDGISLKSLKTSHIYIKYSLKEEYIEKLLKENITCNNATEIIKYSSYYEQSLGKGKIKRTENEKTEVVTGDIITENQNSSRTGQIYAGINQGNRPDNIKLKLKSVINEQNTVCIFDTSEYEIDSTAAPAIIICADGVRTISGTIFEDYAEVINNEKNGNGKYDESVDSLISNVKVELYRVDEKGALLSDKPVLYADNNTPIVTEAINGKYTLGGYTDENGNTYGILPGKYIVQYTYGTYKNSNGEEKKTYSGNKNDSKGKIKYINMMDYKSTIISEESKLQAEFKNNISDGNINKSWFTLQEGETYSTAIDNLLLREEYTSPVSSVTNGRLRGKGVTIINQMGISENKPMEKDVMTAKTLPMDINIHFTKEDETKGATKDENGQIQENEDMALTLENVNFGIVERPNIDIKIDKKITNIEVIAQNGASIIPKGNPRDDKMQYITAPDDEEAITAQVDPKLLQGATLNVEYTVTVENNSNIDYICKEYYYFGEKNEEFENTPTAQLVVDYLDSTTKIDETRVENEVWQKKSAEDLKNEEYIDENVYSTLTSNDRDEKYYAYTTSAFEDVKIGDGPKSEKMYVSRKLSISEDITEKGRVEIIEIAGSRAITGAIPGNYNPAESAGTDGNTDYLNESDWSGDEVKFMPPTGIVVDYKMYMIAILAMLTILTIGIIVIKKKVII